MSISNSPLGMNARNYLYIGRYNKASAKRRADDKLETKKILEKNGVTTARIIHAFMTRASINAFDWKLPIDGFVIKPARGYGGEGILVFDKWDGKVATTLDGKTYNLKQLKSHILDIFDGIYSLQNLQDRAYIEERITPNPFFRKIVPMGIPDIRVIVFNKIPIMAMLRLPTLASHGKANHVQGALAVGIGMRTGITKSAIKGESLIEFIPGTKIKIRGIKIPNWDEILLLASRAQEMSGLGYAGIDIVLDKNRGPMVIEINARPGLSIQNANLDSLRSRLERVEDLKVTSPERGVEIAKSIFAEDFSHKVDTEKKMISVIEDVTLTNGDITMNYKAKIDTGAYRSSIDTSIVRDLNLTLLPQENIYVKSASGVGERPAVKLDINLAGRRIKTIASVANRSHLQFPLIIGRRDLAGFVVNPLLPSNLRNSKALEKDEEFEYEEKEE
ncbi:MAG TPA: sugar-transfer associated ATP-grasp domain-containing protein [Patescibacteria group bacterium]|nr:sugar-transfer associated ATP-grasp domain-containing protein [Patescibacteria group bacterium]